MILIKATESSFQSLMGLKVFTIFTACPTLVRISPD